MLVKVMTLPERNTRISAVPSALPPWQSHDTDILERAVHEIAEQAANTCR